MVRHGQAGPLLECSRAEGDRYTCAGRHSESLSGVCVSARARARFLSLRWPVVAVTPASSSSRQPGPGGGVTVPQARAQARVKGCLIDKYAFLAPRLDSESDVATAGTVPSWTLAVSAGARGPGQGTAGPQLEGSESAVPSMFEH